MKKKVSRNQSKSVQNRSGIRIPTSVAVIIGIIVVGLIFVLIQHHPNTTRGEQAAPLANQWSQQVLTVARQFNCPCGNCDDNMAVCDCTDPHGAVEAKNFIRNGLQEGKTTDQMVMAVALKYNISPVQTSE